MDSPNKLSHKTSPSALTERLWFNKSAGTNYQLWKKHVLHHFQSQDLLRFIDDTKLVPPKIIINPYNSKPTRNQDYLIWKRIDESLKQGILSLLEDGVIAPDEVDTNITTSRDVWLYLEKKFQIHLQELPSDVSDEDDAMITNAGQAQLFKNWDEYSDLYSASLLGDWIAGQKVFSTIKANQMNSGHAMALHVAVGAGKIAIDFVRHLICCIPNHLISVKDAGGNTALSIAAVVGNEAAATILVATNSNLLYLPNISGGFPVHLAAKHTRRSTLLYLISVTKDDNDQNPYGGYYGLALLTSTIEAGFLDIALYLVKKYPYLATLRLSASSALKSIVEQKYRDDLNQSPRLLRAVNSSGLRPPADIGSDIESLYGYPTKGLKMVRKLLVIEIVRFLCKKMKALSFIEVEDICRDAILIAAKLGNHEIVGEILDAYPSIIQCSDPSFLQSILHEAIRNRYLDVFNIVFRRSNHMHAQLCLPDNNGNNLMHLVAKIAQPGKLNALSNAALQMQFELQWYMGVEKLTQPRYREQLNGSGESPWMIFKKEHKSLKAEGEKWVKETSNSCAITAALICTITFAAAITVPGGTDGSTGLPLFRKDPIFAIFSGSNILSILFSIFSLLRFLHVSTSRYAEKDFLACLPAFFSAGLCFLILSIACMMMTFGATVTIMFGGGMRNTTTTLILAATEFVMLVIFIVALMMPLLVNHIKPLYRKPRFIGK